MSLRANFLGYAFDIIQGSVRKWEDGRQADAKAMYSISEAQLKRGEPFLTEWDEKNSYMIGLYIWATQKLEVYYKDKLGKPFQLRELPAITEELNQYFGAEVGKTWVGLVSPDGRPMRKFAVDKTNGTVAFDVTVKISPAPTAQFIPFVARYRFDGKGNQMHFRDGFMPGMWRVPLLQTNEQGTFEVCDVNGPYKQTS